MRRLLGLVVLALVGFYVVWPAISLWQIKSILASGDAAAIARKVDFDSVRRSLRPAVVTMIERQLASAGNGAGAMLTKALGADALPKIADQATQRLVTPENVIKIARSGGSLSENMSALVKEQSGKIGGLDAALGARGGLGNLGGAGVQIPGGIGSASGGAAIGGILAGQLGLGGRTPRDAAAPVAPQVQAPAPTPAPTAPAAASDSDPKFGLGNIKRFGFNGPLEMEVGLAKDATASDADLTARIGFTGFDWKIVGLVPRT